MRTAVISVWAPGASKVALATGEVVTNAGAIVTLSGEVINCLVRGRLFNRGPALAGDDAVPVSDRALSVTSTTALATVEAVDGQLCSVAGLTQPGDGAGGVFYLDKVQAPLLRGMVLPGPGGKRWKRLTHDNMLNVKWFGAVGDGVADDTAPIQAAINACVSDAGGVYLPRGLYRITDSIKCGFAYNGIVGIRVVGETQTPGNYTPGVRILWDSAATDLPAFWFSGRNFHFEGIGVQAFAGRTLHSGFELGNLTAAAQFNSTSSWKRCSVFGPSGNGRGIVSRGFSLGSKNSTFNNLENCVFENCITFDVPCGIHIASGQPYNTAVRSCAFQSINAPPPNGVGVLVSGTQGTGSLTVRDSDFQSNEVGVRVLETSMTILMSGGESEGCKKLLHQTHFGLDSVPCTITITGMRINNSRAGALTEIYPASDTDMIVAEGGDALVLIGNEMDDAGQVAGVRIKKSCPLVSTGNTYSTNFPFNVISDASPDCAGVFSTGDRLWIAPPVGGSQTVPLPTLAGGLNASYAGALSTITGAATSVAVVLPRSERSTNYKVRLDVDAVTGAPAAGAFCGYVTSKTAAGFNITVPTAPGGVASVTYRYTTYR